MNTVLLPQNLDELWRMRAENPGASLYAGGTDLLVRRRAGLVRPAALICLERIAELRSIYIDGDVLAIGACATHRECLESSEISRHAPVLAQALRQIGGPHIRNMGTIGGNICTASPAGDSLPPLYMLEAEVALRSPEGERRMPISQFIIGPGQNALNADEILDHVRIPLSREYSIQHFEKVGQRNAMAIAIVSLAAVVRTGARGIVEEARLALGSVGPTVLRCTEAEEALTGRRLSMTALREAGRRIRPVVRPIDDIRASAAYRREVAGSLPLRLSQVGPDHSRR